ncbi:SAM and PH domain-containing protein [Aspergillus stella-maris]|uniref:SAM and PH domain-containing protein n=1 Tax=Aspergillus stella-maris TaxID=1810926 RepID=UPI003CCD19FB
MPYTQGFQPTLDYRRLQEKLYNETRTLPRYRSASAMSEATEIYDSDIDTASLGASSDGSPYGSAGSLVAESVTTLSSVDDAKTPDTTGLSRFTFALDGSPIRGPQGPHLFRTSEDSLSRPQLSPEWGYEKVPDSAIATHFYTDFKVQPQHQPQHQPSPVPVNIAPTPSPPPPQPISRPESGVDIAKWSPNQVVRWMQGLGFDESVTEKFYINDISGAILLELQVDDLKELEIASFGKRHQLMACIKKLRECQFSSAAPSCDSRYPTPDPSSRLDTRTPQTTAGEVGAVRDCFSPVMDRVDQALRTRSGSRSSAQSSSRQDSIPKRGRQETDVVPQDSVSIVAIEQLLPKLHVCSKGENCRKWQKQQSRVARLLKDLQLEGLGGSVLVTGDPGNPSTAQSVTKSPKPDHRPPALNFQTSKSDLLRSPRMDEKTPKSDITPSLIASSDLMGANLPADIRLSQEKLESMKSRDPQENVRNFLNFQRLSSLKPVTDPATPPDDEMSMEDSPISPKGVQIPTLANNLRTLPKLQIPSLNSPGESVLSPSYSALRTITPSVYNKGRQYGVNSSAMNTQSSFMSPSDYYRVDSRYEVVTPQVADDPMTAVPVEEIERGCSQSVPPDMRFGGNLGNSQDSTANTKSENHRRLHSAALGQGAQKLVPVAERSPLPPIDTLEDYEKTPRAPRYRNNPFSPGSAHADDIIHSGWMKKRKTTKLIRHEWEDHHFALRGTQLCMYNDEEAAQQNSKALERIDVDDYAVACSSLQSKSKLTAAFKKTVLKRVNDNPGDATAFAFSLIPGTNNNGVVEKKPFLASGPKSHHFAVKTREERIDWMRELMLAKALRRSRESGDSGYLNGEPF